MARIRNVAVVGLGIGRSHIAEGYSTLPDRFRVAALCDLNEERLEAVGEEFGVTSRITSFDDVLAMDDIDIVDICTPPMLHESQIQAALRAGKDVICEKPLAGCLAHVDAIIEAEKQSTGRVMPIFQYRYGNGLQKAKRIIDLGLAGTPYLASVETAWRRLPAYYEVPWRGRWDTELGGVLTTHAIHSHDIMTWLMGPADTVYCRTATRVNAIEVEDCAIASLVMRSGALVSLAATLGSQEEVTRLRFCFENVTFESSQGPYCPGDDPWRIVPRTPEIGERIEQALTDWTFVPSRFAGQLAAYHDALDAGGSLPVTLQDSRRSLELLTALYHSAETGRAVELPIGNDHPKYASWRPAAPAGSFMAEAHS
ncbi:Gfo/Idh/MocA family protein [Marinivivus vitaminiproducens]|uniref:Gfo/Idh/MocA family protein n=1 Tax=Marinivivus vitaminiproducens TaxID=3035935 RepID=UPI00279EB138|nr:Gfo/Idh/MocA family oxidoreductase [Geminicoccaceae bacterium SCSIO 64248]